MADAVSNVDALPNMTRFRSAFGAFWPGLVGGAISGIGAAMLGAELGTAAGGMLAAAVVGGDAGKTIATVAGMETAQLLFVGGTAEGS